MNTQNRKPLIAMIALSAALVMPLAFAQSSTTGTGTTDPQASQAAAQETQVEAAQDAATQAETPPQSDAGVQSETSATGAATQSTPQTSASAGQQGWEQVDTDMDGAISKQEAAANPSLTQIFGQADANADGSLTTDEYKIFVDKNYGEPKIE